MERVNEGMSNDSIRDTSPTNKGEYLPVEKALADNISQQQLKNEMNSPQVNQATNNDNDLKTQNDERVQLSQGSDDNQITESDDDFDEFNVANEVSTGQEADGDSDFGSFDDASFNELEEPEELPPSINADSTFAGGYIKFDDEVFNNSKKFDKNLKEIMDCVFPNVNMNKDRKDNADVLLSGRSTEIFEELSKLPHLQPPNWTKLNIRHNLLIKLGIPINLDEINKDANLLQTPTTSRRKSVNEGDIKWDEFSIPSFEELNINGETKNDLLLKTSSILSSVETDNLNNSTKQFLEASSTESLQVKLKEYHDNYNKLIELSSIWNNQLNDLKKNFEVYESVIQNLIGYSQKLKREEILAHINKLKTKPKIKKKSFWK